MTKLPLGVHEGDEVSGAWVLFTPDFAYAKCPYEVRTHEGGEVVRCYPNGGWMHAQDGSDRWFGPCECEVRYVGWERDESGLIAEPAQKEPTRSERQAAARERRKDKAWSRRNPGTWRAR